MSRQNFHDLLTRYLEGNCTAEEKETVEHWYKMLDDETVSLSSKELSFVENRLWTKINFELNEVPDPAKTLAIRPFYTNKRSILAWAAVLTVFITIGLLLFYNQQKTPDFKLTADHKGTVYQINQSTSPQKIYLEDGSFVVLKPGSALTYPKQFEAAKREVYLTGEAYFKISKNPDRPFLVYNNNTITRVVGTSFVIRVDEQTHQTEVSVQTGKVIVTENTKKNLLKTVWNKPAEVILTPNQKAIFSTDNQDFKTTLVALPLPVYKQNNTLSKPEIVFNETPVASVLNALNKTYGIEIIGTKEVNEATFTGDLDEMNLYGQLDLICQSIHATYQISGTKIYIK
ncbi:MAG: FecR family protein [Janthinobacterium lividum]